MAIIYRNITGPVSDAQGVLIPTGELIAKLLRPLVDSLTFISPEELRVPIVDGLFTLVLAAPAMYDFQVIDQFGQTWWNFQAPLDNDTPADISLAELFVLSGYVEQAGILPITSFRGLMDTPDDFVGFNNHFFMADEGTNTIQFVTGLWEDLRFPLVGENAYTAGGRIDYDFDEVCLSFQDNARYPDDPSCASAQFSHAWVEGTDVEAHLHWLQTSNADPNWLLQYRYLPDGYAPTGWQLAIPDVPRVFTYVSGTLCQITAWPTIDMTGYLISDTVQFRLFRDTADASTLFGASDLYTGNALAVEFDVHHLRNSFGSENQWTK
jgi:hypothetical protein